ncbi:hypothetical protein ACH518_19205 [Methylomonas sp. HW2-6]|uniref:hypothetical protein n=1 Tax=Methylomonas sp. HW2-6 TaxID=3376687 RepID=UPI00404198B1
MSDYRRVYIPGGCYFFTVVTYRRQPIFADERNVAWLRQAFKIVKVKRPFELTAAVVLPDHLHSPVGRNKRSVSGKFLNLPETPCSWISPETLRLFRPTMFGMIYPLRKLGKADEPLSTRLHTRWLLFFHGGDLPAATDFC